VTDSARLQQILNNLVHNAVKFTETGKVEIRVRYEPREKSDGVLMIDVADTGPGMSAETLERLFQPFSQADS
jgi:signal transduction histidine kinase